MKHKSLRNQEILDFAHGKLLEIKNQNNFLGKRLGPELLGCLYSKLRKKDKIQRLNDSKRDIHVLSSESYKIALKRILLVCEFWVQSASCTPYDVGSQGPVFVGDGWEEVCVREARGEAGVAALSHPTTHPSK